MNTKKARENRKRARKIIGNRRVEYGVLPSGQLVCIGYRAEVKKGKKRPP